MDEERQWMPLYPELWCSLPSVHYILHQDPMQRIVALWYHYSGRESAE